MIKRENSRFGIILITIIAAILIVVALIVFTNANSKRITNENREYLLDNAEQTALSIDAAISDGYYNIKMLSSLVSNSLTGPDFDISSIQGLIKNSVFDFVEFADKYGMDHNITGGVSDATDRKYYLDAKAGNSGMELIYVSRATHETLLMFYSPVYYEDEFVGSIVGVYQASNRITRLLSGEYFGESTTAYLATGEGRIIASNQGFDPRTELYVTNLAEGNPDIENQFLKSLETGETVTFALEENSTGGCMMKLPDNGWFLIQIFPQAASNRMIRSANKLSYYLVGFLLILCIVIMISLIRFYRLQQKQVDQAKNQAEMANLAKTNFLFNMSHDIRTPMNAIIGFNNMALKNLDDKEKVKDSLLKTSNASNMLLTLINSILDMSRIESGKAVLEEREADIYDSFRAVETTMTELAKSKNIELTFEINRIVDRYVYIDYDRVTRVFTNIITNAIKYTPKGGHVFVTCEQIGEGEYGYGKYRYHFADDGIGMSEEFQGHIFEEFAREENSTTSGIQGTGLGLSVVKTFVELMNGTIDCYSQQGIGTTFIVTIPFRLKHNEIIENVDSSDTDGEGISGNEESSLQPDFRGKRVLLCEDNELNREIATDILEEEGIIVEEAVNGEVAVEIMKEKGPDYYDFILMDIQMPIMDGYEATERIREMYPNRGIPIIALSANAFAEDKEASIKAGMDGHVAKPINISELFETMSRLGR